MRSFSHLPSQWFKMYADIFPWGVVSPPWGQTVQLLLKQRNAHSRRQSHSNSRDCLLASTLPIKGKVVNWTQDSEFQAGVPKEQGYYFQKAPQDLSKPWVTHVFEPVFKFKLAQHWGCVHVSIGAGTLLGAWCSQTLPRDRACGQCWPKPLLLWPAWTERGSVHTGEDALATCNIWQRASSTAREHVGHGTRCALTCVCLSLPYALQ